MSKQPKPKRIKTTRRRIRRNQKVIPTTIENGRRIIEMTRGERDCKSAQQELKPLNEINDLRGFHPHVTVAFRDSRKSRFATVWDELRQRTIKGEFSYRGFSLLKLEDKWRERCFFERELDNMTPQGFLLNLKPF